MNVPIVPPLDEHEVLFTFAVVVDGDVFGATAELFNGGLIFTFAVIWHVTLPVALPRFGFAAPAAGAVRASPPNPTASAAAEIPILRSIVVRPPVRVRCARGQRRCREA
jgi:hypothetical protein